MRKITLLALFLFPTGLYAQEIDVKENLEAKLRGKLPLTYGEVETVMQRKCEWIYSGITSPDFGPTMIQVCKPHSTTVDRTYQAYAKVVSTEVIEIRDFKFHTDRMTSLPSDLVIKRKNIFQCTDGNFSTNISEQLQATEGWQFIKSRSVQTTNSVNYSASVSYSPGGAGLGGSAGVSLTHSTALTVGKQQTDSLSKTVIRGVSDTYSFSGPKAVAVDVFAYRTTVDIPYSGVVFVDAVIASNKSGVVRASQLLSPEERTFPIEGILRVSDVSNADFRVFEKRGGCLEPELVGFVVESVDEQYETAASLISIPSPNKTLGTAPLHMIGGDLLVGSTTDKFASTETSVPSLDQVIGPPDGTSYRVVFTRQEIRTDPTCGYTDLGLPKTRSYSVEQREYQQAQNGRIVRTWMESVAMPGQCLPGI